jgi:hypothetical protein
VNELAWNGSWNPTDTHATAAAGSSLSCLLAGSAGSRVYYAGLDNNIHELSWDSGSWAITETTANVASKSSLPCFYIGDSGSRVYYAGSGGHISELAWTGSLFAASPI